MQDRFTAIVALSILAAFLFVAFAFFWEGTLKRSFAAFRKMPRKRQIAVLVAVVLLGLHAFAKNGPLMGFRFGSTPNVERVSENVRRGGHALVRTKTNVELDLAPPSGAITNDDWLRSGAHEDWFQIVSGNGRRNG